MQADINFDPLIVVDNPKDFWCAKNTLNMI